MHVDKSFTKIQARVRSPPPIQAMPEFWEHLDLAPLPKGNGHDNNDDYKDNKHENNDDFIGQRKKTSSGAASVQLLLRPGFDLHIVIS